MAADRLELVVEAPQLIVHPVHVGRQRAQLVTVVHDEAPGEVAFRDLREPLLGALDGADERRRQDEPEQRRQQDARGAHADEQVPRGGVGAAVLGDQRVGLPARPRRELVGDDAEVEVVADRSRQEALARTPAADAVRRSDLRKRGRDEPVVRPDAVDQAAVGRRRLEFEARRIGCGPDLRQRRGDRLVGEHPRAAPHDARAALAEVPVQARVLRDADRQELAQLPGLGLQALVARGSQLQLPERLDPGVGLAEDAQAQDGDDDQQRSDRRERDEQLRPDLDGRAADGPDDEVQGVRLGVAAAPFVISHLPLIFWTFWSAPTTATTLRVLTST